MPSISELRTLGLNSHTVGDLDRAAEFYRQMLDIEPLCADGWHLLGVVAHQQGRHDEAAETIQKAIDLEPSSAVFYANLAEVERARGQLERAVDSSAMAIQLEPKFAAAYNNLAVSLLALGRMTACIAICRAGLDIKPDFVELWNNLGEACRGVSRSHDSMEAFQRALEIDPNFAPTYLNLSNLWRDTRRLDKAAEALLAALKIQPHYAKAHCNLSMVRLEQLRFEESDYHAREAIRLDPRLSEAQSNMSALRHQQGRLAEAQQHARAALELDPELAEAHNNLAAILQDCGSAEEALVHFVAAWQAPRGSKRAFMHSNHLFGMHYVPHITPQQLLDAHRDWNDRYVVPLAKQSRLLVMAPVANRPLRLGLVSADLGCHPVGQFVSAWLAHLDPEQMQVIGYSDRPVADELSERLKAHCSLWRDVQTFANEPLADQIRDDRIDVLVDLAGHTRQNRLLMFSRRPAMVQASWTGYVGTTGLEAMDYLIADRYVIPEEEDIYYRERVLRMPDGWLCYAPPANAPEVAPPPCLARGQVTFGCFNKPAKITPAMVATWCEILQRVPDSRLLLKFKWFDDPGARELFLARFAGHGIEASRIELQGWSPQSEHLASHAEIDLALDTFPYTGGITTCDALWMGVPVVTLVGRTFASRQSYSHLMNVGLPDLATWSTAEYVDRAVAWATDADRLVACRRDLRTRMKNSPLCDGPRFARNLQQLLGEACRTRFAGR